LLVERLRQSCSFHKETALAAVALADEHRGVNDVLIDQPGSTTLLDMKSESAARKPIGLFTHVGKGLAADGYAKPP